MNLMYVRRFWLAGVVLVAVLVLLPFSFHAEHHLETATRIEGSEAEIVTQDLANRFRSPFVDRVVLVVQGLPPVDSEEGEQALGTIEERLGKEPGVRSEDVLIDLVEVAKENWSFGNGEAPSITPPLLPVFRSNPSGWLDALRFP